MNHFLLSLGIFLLSVAIHEYAHGLVAFWFGDKTAQYEGRLTLNPLAHIDLFGTIILPILLLISHSPFIFGWAKPVPINYWGLRKPKRDIIWVGLAGPLANIIVAVVLSLIIKLNLSLPLFLLMLIVQAIVVNLILAIFNLLPIPPLDGSRVAIGILPEKIAKYYSHIEPYGILILIGLLYFNLIDYIVWPIVNIFLNILKLNI